MEVEKRKLDLEVVVLHLVPVQQELEKCSPPGCSPQFHVAAHDLVDLRWILEIHPLEM